jgi:hypothetical protein
MKLFGLGSLGVGLAAALLACSGDDGAPGAPGAAGTGTPGKDGTGTGTPGGASVNGITPGTVFLARSRTLTISGSGTTWTKEKPPTVDFGDAAIKVDKIAVASPTALLVDITAGPTAKVGSHTVKVGEQSYVGFEVDSPVALSITGKAGQGSLVLVTVKNKDIENPFDTTATGDGLFSPKEFVGIAAGVLDGAQASARFSFNVGDVQSYSATFTVAIDVDAKAGKSDFVLQSGAGQDVTSFIAPASFDVAAASPKPFSGAAITNPIGTAFNSTLFETTPAVDSLNSVSITAAAGAPPGAAPSVFLLPAPGHFADAIRGSSTAPAVFLQEAATKYYAVVEDLGGKASYNFTMTNTAVVAGQALAEVDANNTMATAQVATTFPFLLKGAKLSSTTDEDWIKVTAPGGKKLRARTLAGDAQADPVLEFRADDGTTVLDTSDDEGFHEDLTSATVLAAGTYFIKATASSFTPPAATKEKYVLWVTFE